jgi:hypothetical protein
VKPEDHIKRIDGGTTHVNSLSNMIVGCVMYIFQTASVDETLSFTELVRIDRSKDVVRLQPGDQSFCQGFAFSNSIFEQ